MNTRYPCQTETTHSNQPTARRNLTVKRVDECETLDELFLNCLPAFGGRYLRRIYHILDQAIGVGLPDDAVDRRSGDRFGAAPCLAHSAARNRLGRLPQHHRRGLLSRRPSQLGNRRQRPVLRGSDLRRRRRAARRSNDSRHRYRLSTKMCCSNRTTSFRTACGSPSSSAA